MRAPAHTQASLSTQFSVWFRAIPFATGCILAACCAIWLFGVLLGFDNLLSVCMSPFYVINEWQVWRFLTFPFFHVGLLHLGFNMMAWVPLGGSLERLVGSVQLAYLTFLFASLGGTLHTLVSAIGGGAGFGPRLEECAVGLSGVIFSLVVVDSHLSPQTQRSLFGFFTVPAKWYPLALLMILQLLIPNASLVGHLSGLVVGYAYAWGYLNWIVLSPSAVTSFERAGCLRSAVAQPNFIVMTGNHDARGGGLPRWVLSGEREGSQWRFPPWLEAAWAAARNGAASTRAAAGGAATGGRASGEPGGEHTFPGQGYAVGGTPGVRVIPGSEPRQGASRQAPTHQQPQQSPPQPRAAVPTAPDARQPSAEGAAALAEARARAARAAEARAAGLAASSAAAVDMMSLSPPPQHHQGSAGQQAASNATPGLRTLLDMGVPEAQARSSLLAAGGDIMLAIEIATAEAQP